jgi:cephalosporin hydroxylase
MNLAEVEQIAIKSVSDPIGCGIPELEELNSLNPYYRFFYNIVKEYKPKFVLECGVDTAASSLHMVMANPDTYVMGIDRNVNENARYYNEHYPNFTLFVGDTADKTIFGLIRNICGEDGIGLLFLDSEHDGITAKREFATYFPLLADGCLVCIDDIHLKHEMEDLWNNFPGEKKDLSMLHGSGFGVSIIRK